MNINISGEVVRTSQLPKRIIGLGDYLVALNSSPLETSTVLVSDFVSFLNTQFATSLASLTDVSINGPLSGQALVFNGSYWVNQNLVSSLAGLSDVTIASLNPDQLLRYDGTSWKNWTPTFYSLPVGGTTLQYIDGTGALQTLPTTLPTSTVKHQVKAGVPITKGQAVYVTSADGTNMIVGLASNASESTSSKTMGLLDATVTTNGFANVVTEGLLAGLDTTGANAAGDPVWLGTGGNLIYGLVNKPYAPNHLVFIGIVTRRNANNGEIFVKVQNGFELSEIHDVDARNPDNNDGIFYNSATQLWEHKQISSVFPTPTLASVTTAGNTTTNSISTGNITASASNVASLTLVDTLQPYAWSFRNNGTNLLFVNNGGTNIVKLTAGGNVLVGTNTDAGYKLDVNGTGRYSSTLTIQTAASDASPSNSILISTSSSGNGGRISWGDSNTSILRYSNSLYFREYTGNFRFESTGSGAALLHISEAVTTLFSGRFITSGSTTATSALARGVYFNNTLVAAANNDVLVGLDINPTFTNGAFTNVTRNSLRIQGNNGGSHPLLSVLMPNNTTTTWLSVRNTNDYLVGTVAAEFGVAGTAGSFFTGTAQGDIAFKAYSQAGTSKFFIGATSGSAAQIVLFPSTNNVSIGTTTDAGYKLDVNGTARVVSLNGISFLTSNEGTTGNLIAATGRNITFVEQGQINTQNGSAFTFRAYADSPQSLVQNALGRTTNFIWVKSGFTGANYANTTGIILNINPTYNLTGTNSGTLIRGIYYNPILTDLATATHRAIETTSGDVLFGGTVTPFFWDNANARLGVGTNSPTERLTVNGGSISILGGGLSLFNGSTAISASSAALLTINAGGFSAVNVASGNLLVGTTTDAGYKLDVNGTGIFRGNLKLATGVLSLDNITSYLGNSIRYESSQIRIYQSGDIHAAFGGGVNYLYKNTKISPNLLLTAGGYSNTDGITIWGTQNAGYGGDGFVGRNLYYDGTNYVYATTDSSNLWGTVAGVRVLGNSRPATNSGLNVVASDIASYTRMVISYSGNVGIGTTTDGGYKLNVTGNNYNTFVTNAPFLVDTSANNYRIANLINNPGYHTGGYANNTFDIFSVGANSSSTANGSPFFRVNLAGGSSTGYYGAAGQNQVLAQLNGVTTATLVLSAQGSGMALIGSTSINPTITTIAQGSNLNLRSDVNGSYAGGGINYFASINGSNHSHVWYFNSAEQMRLMYTGNLLLGTATDSGYKLDVNGTARFGDLGNVYYMTLASGGSDGGILRVGGASYGYAQLVSYALTLNGGHSISGTGGVQQFSITSQVAPTAAQSNAAIKFVADNPGSGGGIWGAYSTALAFNFLKKETGGTYTSILAMNGGTNFVGIGTTTPFGKLDVKDGEIFVTTSTNANLRSRLTYQGLYVSRSSDGTYPEQITSASSAWEYHSRNNHVFYRDGTSFFQVGQTSTAAYMTVNNTGNILIGTTTDSARLTVKGSGSTSATKSLLIQNSAGTVATEIYDDRTLRQWGQAFFHSSNTISFASDRISMQPYTGFGIRYRGVNVFELYATETNDMIGLQIERGLSIYDAGAPVLLDNSAKLQINSTNRGFLAPRMTTAQILLITSPAEGLQVYNTDLHTICFFDGTIWQRVTSTAM
jgi:hypothetical protein